MELRAAQAELVRQERLATLGQLTATVGHELRNPLAAMRISLAVIRRALPEPDEGVGNSLDRLDRTITRCDRIIDELLDFTRITRLERSPTILDSWLCEVLDEQRIPAGIQVIRDLGLDDYSVSIDGGRLRRAVTNVFENACQAMIGDGYVENPESSRAARLIVRTSLTNDRIEVAFDDQGPGIAAGVLPKIFEPLFSTKTFGVGLGLPVVKQIMEQHQGGVEVENRPQSGARVRLWLPREDAGLSPRSPDD